MAILLAIVILMPAAAIAAQTQTYSRDDTAAAFVIAVEALYAEYGINLAEILEAADFGTERFVDLLHAHFVAPVGVADSLDADEFDLQEQIYAVSWLYAYFYDLGELDAMLRNLVVSVAVIEIMGYDTAMDFFQLPVFTQLESLAGLDKLVDAMYSSPHFLDVVNEYGAGILSSLDFDFIAAFTHYVDTGEIGGGIALLNRMMNTNLHEDLRQEFEHRLLLEHVNRLVDSVEWDYIDESLIELVILESADVEQRKVFAPHPAMVFVAAVEVDAFLDENDDFRPLRLSLFFHNQGGEDAIFYIHIPSQDDTRNAYAFIVPAGERRTIQLTAEQLMPFVEVVVMTAQGTQAEGEFALRLTEHPL